MQGVSDRSGTRCERRSVISGSRSDTDVGPQNGVAAWSDETRRALRDALQQDDGQMMATARMADFEIEPNAGPSTDENVWSRAAGSSRPSRTRLESRSPASGSAVGIDFMGSFGTER